MLAYSSVTVAVFLAPPLLQVQGTSLETAVYVAVLVAAVSVTGMFVLLLGVLVQLYRAGKRLGSFTRKSGKGLDPILDRTKSTMENLDFITRAIRTDVQRLSQSVSKLNDRLNQASDRMEQRIEEFNALMEVVQGEAEDIFIDTASAVRGVRAGTRALGGDEEPDPVQLHRPAEPEALHPSEDPGE